MEKYEDTMRHLTLGGALKQIRQKKKLKQNEVAEQAGIHPRTLNKIEEGSCSAKMGTFINIARVLGYSLKYTLHKMYISPIDGSEAVENKAEFEVQV